MGFNAHKSFPLTDRSFYSITRKDIQKLAQSYGFNENKRGKLDIILSELMSNLSKHTLHGGELLVKPLGGKTPTGIEILCLDHGPGMRNPTRMMEDGTSTVGSQGEGLGAIKRLSDEFDLFSQPNVGTVILSRLYSKDPSRAAKPGSFDIGVVMVPKPGETACGDAWTLVQTPASTRLFTLDGLGHGPQAQEAANAAIDVFLQHPTESPATLLGIVHEAIKSTRGAVGAITILTQEPAGLTFCGIGNITGKVFHEDGAKNLVSYNGIIGANRPTLLKDHLFSWNESSVLVLYSDGLSSKIDLTRYGNLKRHDPSLIAAVLYQAYARRTDDSLILVGKAKK